jgi:4-hydroxybenzoate polyprenyltransferase
LIAGVLVACIAGWLGNADAEIDFYSTLFRTGTIATLLAVCIVLYDGPLKRTIVAPVLMGGCRTLNILLGASTFIPFASGLDVGLEGNSATGLFLGLPLVVWWVAVAIGTLITGATLLGRKEAVEDQGRLPLAIGGILIVAGLVGLSLAVYCPTSFEISDQIKQVFPLFIGIISLTILRRVVEAVVVAKPKPIQASVIAVLRSLIILDAAICYLVMPQHVGYAFGVLALLIPTVLLGRYISTT